MSVNAPGKSENTTSAAKANSNPRLGFLDPLHLRDEIAVIVRRRVVVEFDPHQRIRDQVFHIGA